ncbi:PH and SEC7 domain-containing protein 4 [Dromiciops gliroides]|uniref:PH and SEC7 domain-containing protein 4 n=1 Tax=Dromiciops gliroides TaxID=33562 RepID=UPI001CC56799|nr:PH and SEC7 domain-containing protein 4 [Dromiciops gliroides]XP_043842615.1 PH and SEC7 domain-containing protein 4 [Dromiciops gliroides]XP_043842616.1 PH and SEC7 domain-containing protein 4 [Dromiciops gliroides]XP_043842617.1 PH and SEC7 domain-containing protein 4 [Dromiciops gliroides]XP_043842618.1 PH and SEC7 domain-containing protein 4 [Dromiciops gliroides]
MMDGQGLPGHPESMGYRLAHFGENLQQASGDPPRGIYEPPEVPAPCIEQAWVFDPTNQDVPQILDANRSPQTLPLAEHYLRSNREASPSSPREPLHSGRDSHNNSTQVMFWAGILQAQMCVLDLEEELEKTDVFREELRRCIPSPMELPDFSPSRQDSQDQGIGLRSSHLADDSEEDSSGLEEEPRGFPQDEPLASPVEWGEEEESLFFDNPLFLESPTSVTSVPEEPVWSFPVPDREEGTEQVRLEPETQWTQRLLLEGGGGSQNPESEPNSVAGVADPGREADPSYPVPTYKLHYESWVKQDCLSVLDSDSSPLMVEETLSVQDSHTNQWTTELPSSVDKQLLGLQERGPGESNADTACPVALGPCITPASFQEPGSLRVGVRDLMPSSSSSLSPNPSPSLSPSPNPSPVQPLEGSFHPDSAFPEWRILAASCPSSSEKEGADPAFLKTKEPLTPGRTVEPQGEVQAETAGKAQQDVSPEAPSTGVRLQSTESQTEPQGEGQGPEAEDKVANGLSPDQVSWKLASRLYHLDGFRKSEVAVHLQKNNDFSREVAEKYLSFFQFKDKSLDQALRSFLQALVLSGETQERERILYQFSKRFHQCNPGAFPSADAVHTLTCALMLLNTDLHGQNIGKSMSCQEFITNLNGLRDGGNFPKEQLKTLYWSIRSEKLEWAVDEEEEVAMKSMKHRPSISGSQKRRNTLVQFIQDPNVPTYKQGVLARKMHADVDGKKTPWGKRGWKVFHTLLRGMVLYFLKGEESCPEDWRTEGPMPEEAVGVHHALALPAVHYTKKPHVFQLRTADWRLYLFHAPTAKEMSSWIARINLAAATHSAPPFPAAVGSQRKFVRPILPTGPARSSLEEQHRSHESCLDAASDDLIDLQRNLPERRGRSRDLEEYRLRKEYLEYEKTRYETYVQVLVARLHCPSDDLDLWESQLAQEVEGTWKPEPSLKKSHSSPSLHQEEAPTTAKVKRNISERRTYRKIIPKRNRNQL